MPCTNYRKREQYINVLRHHFWKRWANKYVIELREHHMNDVVLVKDDNLKQSDCRMGKITDLIESTGKQVRTAKVQVIIKGKRIGISRPVDKMPPLETEQISRCSDFLKCRWNVT